MANEVEKLPRLLEQARSTLAQATTAAEYLDAGDLAGVAYGAAKTADRLAKIRGAHDTVRAACHRVMGEALIIVAQAHCRLADEYDEAQRRGEVRGVGQQSKQNIPLENISRTVSEIGLTSKRVHEARIYRDAERRKPGIVREAIEQKLQAGQAPTLADVRRALQEREGKRDPPPAPSPAPSPVRPAAVREEAASRVHAAPTAESTDESEAESEADTDEIDHAIDVILDHLETLEPDRQMDFVDHILLPIKLASRRLTRRDKLTWEPGIERSYSARIMNEAYFPGYYLYPSEMDAELYGVTIYLPDNYEVLVDEEKGAGLPLAEAKKFAEKRHAKKVDP
jgi:hypothetical protein